MRPLVSAVFLACLLSAQAQTIHELRVTDDGFIPAYLPLQLGDQVHIVWSPANTSAHSFTQVDQDTWNVGGALPLSGGFDLGDGTLNNGRVFTITPLSEVWFVCRHHAEEGMTGFLTVEGVTGLEETMGMQEVRFAPNPANGRTTLVAPDRWPIRVRVLDRTGVPVMERSLFAERAVEVSALPPGLYLAEVWYMDGPLLGRKRLLVER